MKYILLFLTISLISCSTIDTYESSKIDFEKNVYIKTSLNDIIENPLFYNGKKVELNGYFYYSIESSFLSANVKPKRDGKVWVEFNYFSELLNKEGENLFKDKRLISYIKKKVKIRGVYDSSNNGNLGIYNGSITDIVYFESWVN